MRSYRAFGVHDVRTGDLDVLAWLRCLRRHEPRPAGAVVGEGNLAVLRDDLHHQVREGMARASLVRVGRCQQVPVPAAQVQLNMDVAVGLAPHAIDPAADRDASFPHVQPERQVDPVERIARTALP